LKQLIIFSEFKDQSTNKVINWINFLGHSVIRINQDDTKFQVTDIQNDLISVKTFEGNHYINKDDIIWFRRLSVQSIFFVKDQKDVLQNSLYSFERLERNSIFRSLLSWLSSYCYCIGNPEMVSPDKINILQLASEFGLNVPDWLVTSKKENVLSFLNRHQKIITKSFNSFFCSANGHSYRMLTSLVTIETLDNYPKNFESMFFQKYIEKKYELRIFYWLGDFFVSGIFSQQDEKTKIDFRNYNDKKPNRNIPLKIPEGL
jgi:hypothetical protein